MSRLNILLIAIIVIVFNASCEQPDDSPAPRQTIDAVIAKNIYADTAGTGRFTFFSFKDNDTIPATDSASTKWDIAFNTTTIIVNSGTSGPGTAGAQVLVGIFDEVSEAPESGYKVDNKNTVPAYAIPTGSGSGWYNYSGEPKHVITPIPGRVLAIRTCDGKYAKVEVISYYRDASLTPAYQDPTSGWYTFRFKYQPDGSRSFN